MGTSALSQQVSKTVNVFNLNRNNIMILQQIYLLALWDSNFLLKIIFFIFLLNMIPFFLVVAAARKRGRSGCFWFILALMMPGIGPLTAGLFLLLMGDSKKKEEKDIHQQEIIKEKYHEQHRVYETKTKEDCEKEGIKQGFHKEQEKPCIENDFLKPPTTDHSRYMPH